MPTYEYECVKCGHEFEKFQSMTEEPLRKCPACSGRVKRLIGAGAGVIFKGSGFYQTDYRSDGYHKEAASDKPKPASSDTDKKPASKEKTPAKKPSAEKTG